MDVTKDNFRNLLPEIDEIIARCDFIAIDCEYSGLIMDNIYFYDYPDDAFKKMSDSSEGYIVIQIGLTFVTSMINEENKDAAAAPASVKYTYKTYNFYIFPRQRNSSTFHCEGYCLAFLAKNKFNFTKLMTQGISFCNKEQERYLRQQILNQQKNIGNANNSSQIENNIPVPDNERQTIEKARQIVEDFLSSSTTATDEVEIQDFNAFQRKLIYQMIEANYDETILATTKCSNRAIVIRRKNDEQQSQIEEERAQKEAIELEDRIGMSIILQKISKSKKPIVGHNMFYDIIFIIRQFFDPIPSELNKFKQMINSIFPVIIDTKYITHGHDKFKNSIKSSKLDDLIKTLSTYPFKLPDLVCETNCHGYSLEDNQMHEAGFDSYLTATVFLGLVEAMGEKTLKDINDSAILRPYLNKIFLMNIPDIQYIDIIGQEPLPPRAHVFYVICTKECHKDDVHNIFKECGRIHMKWLDSRHLWVALEEHENAQNVLKKIKTNDGIIVQSFADYKKLSSTPSSSIVSTFSTPSTASIESMSKGNHEGIKTLLGKRKHSATTSSKNAEG